MEQVSSRKYLVEEELSSGLKLGQYFYISMKTVWRTGFHELAWKKTGLKTKTCLQKSTWPQVEIGNMKMLIPKYHHPEVSPEWQQEEGLRILVSQKMTTQDIFSGALSSLPRQVFYSRSQVSLNLLGLQTQHEDQLHFLQPNLLLNSPLFH